MAGGTKHEIKLSQGLVGQDDHIDVLMRLYEQLQPATVEAACPHLDLFTFANGAHYFAVVLEEPAAAPSTVVGKEQSQSQPVGRWSGELNAGDPSMGWLDPGMELPQDSDETFVDQPTPFLYPFPSSDQSNGGLWRPEWAQTSALLSAVPDEDHVPIGLVYLAASQNFGDPLHVGELSMGIIIKEEHRGKGYGREVVNRVARIAFDEAKCHRLQAILLGRVALDHALSLFTKMNFSHEGTRRRSFFSPMQHEWQDATYMAILDTDWVMRETRLSKSAPKSVWDALFARHQREREDLLRWEAMTTLKRTSSMATVRGELDAPLSTIPDPAPTPSSASEAEHDHASQNGKRKIEELDDSFDWPDDDRRLLVNRRVEISPPAMLSFDEILSDDILSERSASPSSSTSWDVMEFLDNPSSPGSSHFEFMSA